MQNTNKASSSDVATAAGLVNRIRSNVDSAFAGLQPWDTFSRANGGIWDEVVAAGRDVHALVLAELRL